MQQKDNPSTVNRLLARTQDLQDKMDSLSDAREFYDPGTASSSGMSHLPNHPMSIPSPRRMTSRDSCLQPEEWNSLGTPGNDLESPQARDGPFSAPFENSKKFGIVFLRIETMWYRQNYGTGRRSGTRAAEFHKTNSSFSSGSRPVISHWRNFFLEMVWWKIRDIQSRNCISDNSQTQRNFSAERSISTPKYVQNHQNPTITMSWIKEVQIAKSTDDLKGVAILNCLMRR